MSVSCAACEQAWPRFCARCTYLMSISAQWHRAAYNEHMKYCRANHDHNAAVERAFHDEAGK